MPLKTALNMNYTLNTGEYMPLRLMSLLHTLGKQVVCCVLAVVLLRV